MGRVLYVIVVSIQRTDADTGCGAEYMICKNQLNALLKFSMAI